MGRRGKSEDVAVRHFKLYSDDFVEKFLIVPFSASSAMQVPRLP